MSESIIDRFERDRIELCCGKYSAGVVLLQEYGSYCWIFVYIQLDIYIFGLCIYHVLDNNASVSRNLLEYKIQNTLVP